MGGSLLTGGIRFLVTGGVRSMLTGGMRSLVIGGMRSLRREERWVASCLLGEGQGLYWGLGVM